MGSMAALLTSATLGLATAVLAALLVGIGVRVAARYQGRVEELLRDHAGKAQQALQVPLVALGHDHVATDEPAGGGRYLNSGTWVSPHLPYTYLKVVGARAELCRWDPAA
jgi:hypothetical protein